MDGSPVRGAALYKARARQGRDFTGLTYGKITPTDIDALIEYQDKCYVFVEAKLTGASMPYGQKLALERLCDDLQKIKPTLVVVVSHQTPIHEEIDFANANVERYRYKGYWKITGKKATAKQFIDSFLNSVERSIRRTP